MFNFRVIKRKSKPTLKIPILCSKEKALFNHFKKASIPIPEAILIDHLGIISYSIKIVPEMDNIPEHPINFSSPIHYPFLRPNMIPELKDLVDMIPKNLRKNIF